MKSGIHGLGKFRPFSFGSVYTLALVSIGFFLRLSLATMAQKQQENKIQVPSFPSKETFESLQGLSGKLHIPSNL